jgi:Ni/Co efflux regulator RcnB
MKKFGYVIAALAAIAIAAPSIASAETVVVRHGDHHHFRARAEMRDHGWRHHDRHDRMVIVKHRRHEY